jgi:hypothetical protein
MRGGPVTPRNAAPRHSPPCHAASDGGRVDVIGDFRSAVYAEWLNAMSAITQLKDMVEDQATGNE